MNPHVKVEASSPGVLIYNLEESFVYPNSHIVYTAIVDYVKAKFRRGKDMSVKAADRPWNDPGPRRAGDYESEQSANLEKPILHAIVLDFSAVSHVDTTAVQGLIDIRTVVEKWVDHPVEFHFAPIMSPWIRRALVTGGFRIGIPNSELRRTSPPSLRTTRADSQASTVKMIWRRRRL